jgi:hypothetical protein
MLSSVLAAIPDSPRNRVLLAAVFAAAVAILAVLIFTGTAWAAGTTTTTGSGSTAFQNGGQNVGNALMAWGKALLFAVAAIMGIGALVRRSVGEGVTILVIVLILGAFLYDQTDTENLIRNLWGAIS